MSQGILRLVLLATSLGFGPGSDSRAQSVERFYANKTIEVIVGYAPGGGNDLFGRAVAKHLGKHVPGSPALIVQNVPGAGTFVATNRVFNSAPRDGTVLALAAPTIALDEKLGSDGVRFKTAQLGWVGRITSRANHIMMWKTSPIKKIQDALVTEATLAATSASSTVSLYPNVLNNVIGTNFKLILGYGGSSESMLAMERGEAEGHSTSWEAVKSGHPDWLTNKDINIVVQFGVQRHPAMPDVPSIMELAKNQDQKDILTAVMSTVEIGTSYFTTPSVPEERLTALRKAFDATMIDPDFVRDLEAVGVGVNPMRGEDLQKLVIEVSNLTPELVEKVRAVYSVK